MRKAWLLGATTAVMLAGCGHVVTCAKLVTWADDYEEIGREAVALGRPGNAIPDSGPLIGSLVCRPPSTATYGTDLRVVDIYYSKSSGITRRARPVRLAALQPVEVPGGHPTEPTEPHPTDPHTDPTTPLRPPPDPSGRATDALREHPTPPAGTAPRESLRLPPDAAEPLQTVRIQPVKTQPRSYVAQVRFTNPATKLPTLQDPAFRATLVSEARTLEPRLSAPDTQVHMGYWSGRGARDAMVRVLGEITALGGKNVGVWDEGVGPTENFPAYRTMLEEFWYDRENGSFFLRDQPYADPQPVAAGQADQIWGEYSKRYAEMATDFYNQTHLKVKVWCFTSGARPDRIFYRFEYPVLKDLELAGIVEVYFAKGNGASVAKPGDWDISTASRPPPPTPVTPGHP